MKEGDKVRSNGLYRDIQAKFGNTVHTVVAVGSIPGCKQKMVWLDCGGGGFLADGFDVVKDNDRAMNGAGDRMNIENMTKALRLVESRAAFALQHQPDDHAKCGEFLLEVLKGVEATASLAVKDIEVC